MIGKTVSHYQIVEKLGQGGMGEVYRARDTRLGRDVAVKVLPSHLADDPSALVRFEREAKSVAALSHPNILTLFDVGREGPVAFTVTELLEGSTLREHIANGPLPIRKVIDYGAQIAEGLAAAHDKGFIHRDLKPENLFLTSEGRVKILDFGLAKEVARIAQTEDSPTIETLTCPGVVMGTVGYMAPEQVRSQAADQRTDLFALGIVLYELLSGTAPFKRNTVAETMTAVLRDEPPELTTVDSKIPVRLARLIQHCLEKNPAERFQSARDLVFSLRALSPETPSSGTNLTDIVSSQAALPKPRGWRFLAWLAGIVTLLATGVIAGAHWFATPSGPGGAATILDIAPPVGVEWGEYASASFSKDGSQFVFSGTDRRGTALWFRSLASPSSVKLSGTEGLDLPQRPIWSPDSRYLLFAAEGKVKKIDIPSGTVETLWTPPFDMGYEKVCCFSGDWNDEGRILFSWSNLYQLIPNAGTPVSIGAQRSEDEDVIADRWLPDGRHYLYHSTNRTTGRGAVFAGTSGSDERVTILTNDSPAAYADPGYLLFVRSGGLSAQKFDVTQLKLVGDPVKLVDGAEMPFWLGPSQWVSNKTAAIVRGQASGGQLTWFDRSGREAGRVGEPLDTMTFDLSRDGTRVVAAVGRWRSVRLALIDTMRAQGPSWLTNGLQDYDPRFDSKADRIVFTSQDEHRQGLFLLSINDRAAVPILTQTIEELDKTGDRIDFHDWSLDGRLLLYGKNNKDKRLLAAPMSDTSRGQPAVKQAAHSAANEGQFSPDGRWIAYNATESDASVTSAHHQIYLAPYPPGDAPQRITIDGGVQPLWREDGRELFYLDPAGNLMAMDVQTSPRLVTGLPRRLFHTGLRRVNSEIEDYAVTGDGQRFLVKLPVEGDAQPGFTIILNWPALLKGAK
jgi:eukaryotic-like serine/threonine-protein kinase